MSSYAKGMVVDEWIQKEKEFKECRARIAALEGQIARVREAINTEAEAPKIHTRAAAARILSALEATPPAPKVTEDHPMQPVVVTDSGVHRFKSNKCVEALLDHGQKTGFGLNELACQGHTKEDRMQLAQLIGYSVSGYGNLSYVTDESHAAAVEQSSALTAAQEPGRS